ncbi:hypothetical protein H0H92_009739, partial [Tricholoma furcatifolium]
MSAKFETPRTFVYKQIFTTNTIVDVLLNIYPPTSESVGAKGTTLSIPAVVFFHLGGLTVGNRNVQFPTSVCMLTLERLRDSGIAFISADYQLLPPSTGHDIVKDIQDLFEFITSHEFGLGTSALMNFTINPDAIAVTGSSAGGLLTYLAAMHCTSPKPKALVSIYGMGGDFFAPHYLSVKTEPFFLGREILDPRSLTEFLYPNHIPDGAPTGSDPFDLLQPVTEAIYTPDCPRARL